MAVIPPDRLEEQLPDEFVEVAGAEWSMEVVLAPQGAWSILALLQLALRHPGAHRAMRRT
jgi:hypothetical protein